MTSRRWPLYFLPGDATVNRHFETGSDDAGRLPGLFLITGATHVLPSAIKATPSIFHHVLASEDRSGGELRTCWRAAQASERGVFWRTSSATTKGAETFGGVTVHRRKRTTQTLLRHWEMTQDCYHVLGSLGCISPTRSGQAVKGTVIAIHRWSVEAAAPHCSYFPGSSVSQAHRRGVQTTIGQERKGRKPETEHRNTGHASLRGPQRESGRFSVLGSSLTHWF